MRRGDMFIQPELHPRRPIAGRLEQFRQHRAVATEDVAREAKTWTNGTENGTSIWTSSRESGMRNRENVQGRDCRSSRWFQVTGVETNRGEAGVAVILGRPAAQCKHRNRRRPRAGGQSEHIHHECCEPEETGEVFDDLFVACADAAKLFDNGAARRQPAGGGRLFVDGRVGRIKERSDAAPARAKVGEAGSRTSAGTALRLVRPTSLFVACGGAASVEMRRLSRLLPSP